VAGRAGRAFVDVEGLIVHVMIDRLGWRTSKWRRLVAASKARTLKSGLIQVVAEIISRLSREGVLERDDAVEYLANAREAWQSEPEEAAAAALLAVAAGQETPEDDEASDQEEETKEPLSQLVERLDATVFGLIEALDAERADLPRLLDEALKGSLWARQIAREEEGTEDLHRMILLARAEVIWASTTPRVRKGHFAMGVGLEAGLTIDSMADELAKMIDQADAAAIPGDVDKLSNALIGLGERLLVIRPFIPDENNPLPANWKTILRQWVSGTDLDKIGAHNMRVVEEAFTYRLVWALEAIRTRRAILGWSPDVIAGGGAAALETGVPQFMMSMLIRAGLPSRRAAMAAVLSSDALFTSPAEMREWLGSNEIAAFTDQRDWPTADTAALWKRFRTEALSGPVQKWSVATFKRLLALPAEKPPPSKGLYRVLPSGPPDGRTWLLTPDYKPIAPFKKAMRDLKPSLIAGTLPGRSSIVTTVRIGRGKATWPRANDP
jgi:hypothetical protein